MKNKKYNPDFFDHARKSMGKKRFEKATNEGKALANEIRLKMARELLGLNQTDLSGLTQPEVSKIESRKDMKISTLKKYAHALGMKVKISLVSEDKVKGKTKAISILG